jgi:YjbE family integral membrane protein
MSLDLDFLARVGKIVLIDLMLAGDNALVIALAVRSLPRRQQLIGRIFGTAGAVILRVLLIAIATALLVMPFVQLAGGVLLIWIAWKLVRPSAEHEDGHNVKAGSTLYRAIYIIVVADAVMSLDNVVGVAGAAHGDMRLVVFGIALSIPIVVWGSGVLARLMGRFAWIIWVGGGVLGHVAGEMILRDAVVKPYTDGVPFLHHGFPFLLAAVLIGLGWWYSRNRGEAFARARS